MWIPPTTDPDMAGTRRCRGSGRFATTITMISQNARHNTATAQIVQIAAGEAVVRTARSIAGPQTSTIHPLRTHPAPS